MKSWLKIFALIVFISFSFVSIMKAQPGDPGGGGPPVPLGGIELLIAAGALFGAKKWLNRGKKG